MRIRSEGLIYTPPKSTAFGHRTRIRDGRAAWAATVAFLESCTTYRFHDHAELQVLQPPYGPDAAIAAECRRRAVERFGTPISGEWKLGPSQLSDAIAFALDDDRWPRQPAGPSYLTFLVEFEWRKYPPVEAVANPYDREFGSFFGVVLGNQRVFLQPELFFPLPYDSAEIREFLDELDPVLPFRLRDQYFQRLLPSAKGGWDQTRRLPKTWRGPN
jgi:hypothetical protein